MTDPVNPIPTPAPSRSKSYTPAADINLKSLAHTISASWELNPQIVLLWTTRNQFEETTVAFEATLDQRLVTGGNRPVVTNTLAALDRTIGQSVAYLKDYLKEKYGKQTYLAYLPQFGIEKRGNNYTYPADRNRRSEALALTIGALPVHELQNQKYGLAFWTDLKTNYDAALQTAISTDGTVADLVKTKNHHRAQLVKTLNALVHVIKGNYPDEYASVLRAWGFQKEKF